ncbi:hypothetical protein JT358_16875 [Micrococcales bacterium 31B]|nr:hypothetical protein [Micrococcales bacterium 31B]
MPTASPRSGLAAVIALALLLSGCTPLNGVPSSQTVAEACAQLQSEMLPVFEDAAGEDVDNPADAAIFARSTAEAMKTTADGLGNEAVKSAAEDMASAMSELATLAETQDPSKIAAAMSAGTKLQNSGRKLSNLCPGFDDIEAP